MKRRVYFNMKSLEEAQKILPERFNKAELLSKEEIHAKDASGRILAEPVFASLSSPMFHISAMDGYALRARETFEASDDNPITLKANDQAIPVNTGQPLPDNSDAVIMIENVHIQTDGDIEIRQAVYPWQNVRKVGEDIVKTEMLFPSFHKFTPYDIGALLTGGVFKVNVFEKPVVSIIPTGNELISAVDISENYIAEKEEKKSGWDKIQVIDSNSVVISAMLHETGCKTKICPIAPDNYEKLKEAILNEVNSSSHIVLINAGSSSGSEDYTVNAIEELGEVLAHGVTMMPGKPSVIGIIKGKPVFGNPGYPVSAIMSMEKLVIPFICHLLSQSVPEKQKIDVKISKKIPSRSGLTEFRRIVAGKVGESFVATPIKKGAGSITTMTKANAMLTIPPNLEGIDAGENLTVELLRGIDDIEKTLLCIGSHDLTLDIIKEFLRISTPYFNMVSGHVGSLGGILAIRDKMAHIAGSHLLDPETGEYNILYLKKHLHPDYPVRLINLVYRIQGLMIQKNNPKNIKNLEDITRKDIIYINRQRGAGTRVLLDYYIGLKGITPDMINGYENEETTHLAVAAGILSGKAHAGMGVLSAANALDIDFIPIMEERYDLIIPEVFLELPMIKRIFDIIVSEGFRTKVEKLGGYNLKDTGKQFYPN